MGVQCTSTRPLAVVPVSGRPDRTNDEMFRVGVHCIPAAPYR